MSVATDATRTARASKPLASGAATPGALRADFVRLIRQNAHRHRVHKVFDDFCAMGAIAISNAVDPLHRETREARYMQIVSAYTAEEVARFPAMLGLLTLLLEKEKADHLGKLFMEMDLGNASAGQFFTPDALCALMASITLGDVKEQIEAQGFITINEPACGAGAMVIACAEVIDAQEINYQQTMHVTAQDIDPTAVHMCYLQLALLHVPAIIVHGNTIAMTEWAHWVTPAHVMGGWDRKLGRRYNSPALRVATAPMDAAAPPLPAPRRDEHAAPVEVDRMAEVRSQVVAQRAEQLGLFS